MAAYSVVLARSAQKELDALPRKDLAFVVRRLQSLAENPRPPGVKKLSAQERYRVRQGDYRIVYAVDDARRVVDVVKIGHRREVYR